MFEFLKEKWAWNSEKRALCCHLHMFETNISKEVEEGCVAAFILNNTPIVRLFRIFVCCGLNNTGSYSSIVNDFGFSAVLLSQKILVSILILTTGWKTDILLIIFPERRRIQIFLCRLSTETCPLVLAFSISLLSNPHLQKIDLQDFSYELFQKCKSWRMVAMQCGNFMGNCT